MLEMTRRPRIGPRKPVRVFLKEWREHYRLTLDQLAGRFDPPVDKSTVQRWEKDTRSPDIYVLAAVAEALDPDLDWTALARPPAEKRASGDLDAMADQLEQAAKNLRKRAG